MGKVMGSRNKFSTRSKQGDDVLPGPRQVSEQLKEVE